MPPRVLGLFRALTENRQDVDLAKFDKSEIAWLLDSGLGPLLHRATQLSPSTSVTAPYRASLHASDLTARILSGVFLDATAEILRAAGKQSSSITLLKGMSVCLDIYAEPHLRTMGDIDLLVDADFKNPLERLLGDLGYRQESVMPSKFYATHHHSMPFYHPTLQIWVEIHTALFSASTTVAYDKIFSAHAIRRSRIPIDFLEYPTTRLRPELQIPYICSHMSEDLTYSREPLTFIDLILLFRKYGAALDWDIILSNLVATVAATHTYILLSYLARYELINVPPEAMQHLKKIQSGLNSLNARLLHRLIERHLLHARPFSRLYTSSMVKISWETLLMRRHPLVNLLLLPWNLIFPPGHSERYSLRLFRRRVGSLFARR
jgi:putative nucleotidyltransferase-like protein